MEPVGRQAANEGSLLLIVKRNIDAERIQRGRKGRRDQERTGKVVGEGFRRLLEGEGGGKTEEPRIWDNSNGYKVSNLTK